MRIVLFIIYFIIIGISNVIAQFQPPCNCSGGGCYIIDVKHFHKIPNHPAFGNKLQLNDAFCNSIEFRFNMNVTADGAQSSLLHLKVIENCCGGNTNLKIETEFLDDNYDPVIGPSIEDYGAFEYLGGTQDGYNVLRYISPKKLPPSGELSYTINVRMISGNLPLGIFYVQVYRPPVVMVHGLWSDAGAFQDLETALINSYEYYPDQLYRVDYSSTHASSFSTNTYVVEQAVEQVINQCANLDIACGKVNVVCHSMGGLLTRKYIQSTNYASRKDISKIITCNTPHGGSQMANFLLDTTSYGQYVADALTAAGMNCYQGAVADLRVNNPNLDYINLGTPADPVIVHALSTVAAPLAPSPFWQVVSSTSIGTYVALLASYNCGTSFMTDLFNSTDHDQIVSKISQRGGVPNNASATYSDQPHVGSVANPIVINQIKTLLNQTLNNAFNFTVRYNPVNIDYDVQVPCLPYRESGDVYSRSNAMVNITTPTSNSTIVAGSILAIQYTSSMVDTVVAVLRFTQDSVVILGASSSAGIINLPVPPKTLGIKSLCLLGLDSQHKILSMDSVNIDFVTSATLDSIFLYPSTLYMNQLDTAAVTILGHYSDGISRNLNTADSLAFQFSFDYAARLGSHFVKLNSAGGDTLQVIRNGVHSNKVIIRKVGNNPNQSCNLINSIANEGEGSLRSVLACAMENDTIYFDTSLQGDTIFLDSIPVVIDKSLHLVNANSQLVHLVSKSSGAILVLSGATVRLSHLEIISDNAVPSCISNFGNLTLEDVRTKSVGNSCMVDNQGSATLQLKGNCRIE